LRFDLAELDDLTITVVVENSAVSGTQGQWGLSMLVTARHETNVQRILMDVGPDASALSQNMKVLGADPQSISMVVLSHCHGDHTGALATVLREIGKKDVPVVAHPSLFRLAFYTRPRLAYSGMRDSHTEIETSGGRLFLSSQPLELMPGLYTSGAVERTTDFEAWERPVWTLEDGQVARDTAPDDQCVIADVKGKGLVILTGCSHSGIVNICRHVRKVTGVDRIEGIIGGFHLMDAKPDRIVKTIEALRKFGPNTIWSGHCTGFDAEVALRNAFGEKYKHMSIGVVYNVKAQE